MVRLQIEAAYLLIKKQPDAGWDAPVGYQHHDYAILEEFVAFEGAFAWQMRHEIKSNVHEDDAKGRQQQKLEQINLIPVKIYKAFGADFRIILSAPKHAVQKPPAKHQDTRPEEGDDRKLRVIAIPAIQSSHEPLECATIEQSLPHSEVQHFGELRSDADPQQNQNGPQECLFEFEFF